MKKLLLSMVMLLCFNSAFSKSQVVAPEILFEGSVNNQTKLSWDIWGGLDFKSFNQDVSVHRDFSKDAGGRFHVEIPQGSSGNFYLYYLRENHSWPPYTYEKQCKFRVITKSDGDVKMYESMEPNAFISCQMSGSPKYNNLVIRIYFNGNKTNKHM